MANLFFIHTPLQILISQQIIIQEKLEDNYMLYGYIGENKQFVDIYELSIIPTLWVQRIFLKDLAGWASIDKHNIFKSCWKIHKEYLLIKDILKRYSIDSIFLGDMNNFSCKFSALLFNQEGSKIVFFEEGASHYSFQNHPQKGGILLNIMLAKLADIFYYKPFYHIKFGRYRFVEDLKFEAIPFYRRYSVVPHYNKKFDVLIKSHIKLSNKLKEYIKDNLPALYDSKHYILFLSQNIYEEFGNFEAYIETLKDYLNDVKDTECVIILKFHPREQQEFRERIEQVFLSSECQYFVLNASLNIPVEYYLQYVSFKEIVSVYSSTMIYNGYLYPKTNIKSLAQQYYYYSLKYNGKGLTNLRSYLKLNN